MAKTLLEGYRIGGDLIDQLSKAAAAEESFLDDDAFPVNSAGVLPAESPPAGGSGKDAGEAEEADAPVEAPEAPATAPQHAESATPESSSTAATGCDSSPSTPDSPRFSRDGLFRVMTRGEIEYRAGGVKCLFVTSLRVNLKARKGEASYYDSLDLYAARGRASFAQALNRAWGEEPSRVEKDLVLLLEELERERDEELSRGSKKEAVVMSADERELGLGLLRDPKLFERIVADLSTMGYVGEDLNKILLYLCASSRKLDDPLSVLILSQSASGKSLLVETVRRLMPPEDVVAVTSLSDQALNYIENLEHKFLVLGEAVHGEVVEHQIREMLSGKELSRLVTVKDAESGKMQSKVVRTPVIVSSVMSGTSHAVNPENASRCFVVNADESIEQTERIHEHQRRKYSLEKLERGGEAKARTQKAHWAAQRLLVKREIVNDFAPHLCFPTTLMRTRRDHDRFLDLIASVCFLRQYQKKEEARGPLRFIRCDLEDYKVAYRVMVEGVMSSTLRELPKGAVGLYETLWAWAQKEAAKQQLRPEELSFTQRQVRELTGLSHTWVKYALRQLVEYEYLVLVRGGAERSRGFYRFKDGEDIARVDLSMIPTPEAMEKKLAK